MTFELTHDKWPQYRFVVTVSVQGVPVSFGVAPALPSRSIAQRRREFVEAMDDRRTALEIPDDAAPVTARLMRELPIGAVQGKAIESFRALAGSMSRNERDAAWAKGLERRPGRRGRPDREYAEIAALYVDTIGSGTEALDVAKKLGYSAEQVKGFLYQARRRGLLTWAPSKGKAGGQLTPKAIELLKGADHGER
jgi:hypothetical protein